MAFPKRGTRRLTVGGKVYQWHMSPKPKDYDYGVVKGTIRAEGGGPILQYWPAEGFPSPSEAASIIEFAVSRGWGERPGPNQWVGRNDDGFYLSDQRVPAPWEKERPWVLPEHPTPAVSREAGERTFGEASPFSELHVPELTGPVPEALFERWVSPVHLRRFDTPAWAEPLRPLLSELTKEVVRELLAYRDWRSRLAGAYLAAIGGYVTLEEQLGRLLLRNEHHYAGRGYVLALTSFNTPSSLSFLTRFLSHYLGRSEGRREQRAALAGVVHLDRVNATAVAERFRGRWDEKWSFESFDSVLRILSTLGHR